jgi:glycosyltransferase involved in cell wall biosynthesis
VGDVNIDTSSLATTGSNTFNGNQTINGSIILDNGAVIKDTPNKGISFGYFIVAPLCVQFFGSYQISKDVENYLKETVSMYNISLLNNAINYKLFHSNKKREINESRTLKLINIGSFVPKKNQQLLLKIAQKLKEKGVAFEINLLGDGDMRVSMEKESATMNLTDNLIFHGNVNYVEQNLWQSDIYVHVANYEPLGLVLIEAMAAGLPIITLDGKGNRDLIEEGKNGYMVFEEDADTFADMIVSLWSDEKRYISISQYAQVFAQRYNIDTYVTQLIQLYQS